MTKGLKEKERKLETLKIIRLLKKYNIDISGWGSGSTKTVEKLVDEALSGESQLLETKEDGLLRVVEVANGIITFTDSSGVVYKLTEDRQEFRDGRVRRREGLKETSIAEKIVPGEDPKKAVLRGVYEELGIKGGVSVVYGPDLEEKKTNSLSFSGLKTCYKVYKYQLTISAESFSPSGYHEHQEDKNTYFVWERVDN